MWFLLPPVLWELTIILTNFLKIILCLPFLKFPLFTTATTSLSLALPHLPPQTSFSQTGYYLFFQSFSLIPLAWIFNPAETTLPPYQRGEFQVIYCSSCMLLKTSIHRARNSTGDLQVHNSVSAHKNLDPDLSKPFQFNRLINHY